MNMKRKPLLIGWWLLPLSLLFLGLAGLAGAQEGDGAIPPPGGNSFPQGLEEGLLGQLTELCDELKATSTRLKCLEGGLPGQLREQCDELKAISTRLKCLEEGLPGQLPERREGVEEGLKKVPEEARPKGKKPLGEGGQKPPTESAGQEEPSQIESFMSSLIAGQMQTAVSSRLRQFGYDLFAGTVSTFAPVEDVPVGPDYIVGPGDSFTINLWGRVNSTLPVSVDRNGKIFLPTVGALNVGGISFSDLRTYLFRKVSSYYSDFDMVVSMDKLRTIQVYLVGEVKRPGSYTLSSLATAFNALFAAGGPTRGGSLRNIKVFRNGSFERDIDLYDFLLEGDKSQDCQLQSGDTIFVPLIGHVVGVSGNVKRPAIYEMKRPQRLHEMIALAGGPTPRGYLQRVQVERIEAYKKRVVLDTDLSEVLGESNGQPRRQEADIVCHDGDLIKMLSIPTRTQNAVYLEGHVQQPGPYELREGMRLSDILPSFEALLFEPALDYAEVIRLVPPENNPKIIPFNLGGLLSGDRSQDLELTRFDKIRVYSQWDFKDQPRIKVGGEVRKPGSFRLVENMRVSDLIFEAGSLTKTAYLKEAELTRYELPKDGEKPLTKILRVDISKALAGEPEHNLLLQEHDYLVVRQIPELEFDRRASISGEVTFPGSYPVKREERLSSVIKRAGGYTNRVYLKGAIFTRESARRHQQERLNELINQLGEEVLAESTISTDKTEGELKEGRESLQQKKELLERLKAAKVQGRVVVKLSSLEELEGSAYDLRLEDGDKLYIPQEPEVVNVVGEVTNPTSFLYEEGKPVKYYLDKVGGMTKDADEERTYVVRVDGSVIGKKKGSFWGLSWDSEALYWFSPRGVALAKVEPGDTILVPREMDKVKFRKELKDWAQILFQTAAAAGVVIAAGD